MTAILTLYVLAAAAAGAYAYESLTLERAGAIRQISETRIAFVGSLIMVSCNLTINGEIRAGPYSGELPIAIGQVTNIEWEGCTGGEILEILNFPWTIRVEKILERNSSERNGGERRIAGIRPESITGMLVGLVESGTRGERPVGFNILLRSICLYGGRGESPSALLPITRTAEREGRFSYSLGALTILEEVRFRKNSGLESCPGEGFIRGRFSAAEPAQTAIFQ